MWLHLNITWQINIFLGHPMHVLIIQRPKNYHSSQYSEIGTRKWTEIVKRGTRARNTRHRLRNQIKHPISHKSKNIDANESFLSARKIAYNPINVMENILGSSAVLNRKLKKKRSEVIPFEKKLH